MANINEIRNVSIFETKCQTVVNSVNCVGVMGKGIALEFKSRFPEMYDRYVDICSKGLLKPGLLWLYKDSQPWILNFPTKRHWRLPSKLDFVELGLQKFAETYQDKGITSIAFPTLGVASGGLRWDDVRSMMYRYLTPLPNLDVEIYLFDPEAFDSLFDRLYQKIHRFSVEDYMTYIGLKKRQAQVLEAAVSAQQIKTMSDLRQIKGMGEKSIKKVYEFADKDIRRIETLREKQPSLPLEIEG